MKIKGHTGDRSRGAQKVHAVRVPVFQVLRGRFIASECTCPVMTCTDWNAVAGGPREEEVP